MAARAAPGDAQMIRSNPVFGGVVADEPDGAMNVLLDFGDVKFRLRTMNHGKDGVASIKKGLIGFWIYRLVAGKEPAAHHENNARAVRLARLENIECQCRSKFAAINHV